LGGKTVTATRLVEAVEARPTGEAPTTATGPANAKPGSGAGWWVVAALVLGYAMQVAWRLWLARTVWTPVAHGDEDRYLVAARVLVGGPGGTGTDTAAFRRLGYPLVLAPIYWFTHDPWRVYHSAQALGIAINTLTFPLAYAFARRVFGVERRLALGLGFVVAALPAVAYYSEFALTDSIFAPLGLAWFLLLHLWLTGRRSWTRVAGAVGSGAVVGFIYAVHVRGIIMIAIHLALVAYLLVTRRGGWRLPVASALAAALLTRLDWVSEHLIGNRLAYGGVEPDNRLWTRLTTARDLVHILCDASGQIWYSGVGTYGIAAVGIVVAWYRIRGRQADETDRAQRIVLAMVFATTVLIALSSTAALPADGRVSNHAYPRYIAFLMPIYVMLGVLALWRVGRRRAFALVVPAAVMILVGTFLVLARLPELKSEWFHPFDTPEVSFLTNTWDILPVAKATAIGLVLLAVFAFVLSAPLSARLGIAGLTGILVLNVVCMAVVNAKSLRGMVVLEYSTAPKLVANLHIGPGDVVAYDKRVWLGPKLNHQREIYWAKPEEFDDFKGESPPADATVVIAPWFGDHGKGDWKGQLHGWTRVAGDPVNRWTAWFRDGDPRLSGPIDMGNGR
jgi:hypothetical protein